MYHAQERGGRWEICLGYRVVMVVDKNRYNRDLPFQWNERIKKGELAHQSGTLTKKNPRKIEL